MEKRVTYSSSNSYTTLNENTAQTTTVWMAFHGMGYLSRYFSRYFGQLNQEQHYVIIPQAPSKYYQDNKFKHVGASWLTREDTQEEMANVLRYLDAIWELEQPREDQRLIVMGYSQGVSIATRWMARRQIQCDHLLLHSGGIPVELKPTDFDYLKPETPVTYLYGTEDPYINEARKTEQSLKGSQLFGERLHIETFSGAHEVNVDFLSSL